jgi:hypothetical protein
MLAPLIYEARPLGACADGKMRGDGCDVAEFITLCNIQSLISDKPHRSRFCHFSIGRNTKTTPFLAAGVCQRAVGGKATKRHWVVPVWDENGTSTEVLKCWSNDRANGLFLLTLGFGRIM